MSMFSPQIGTGPLVGLCRRMSTSLEAGIDARTAWAREAATCYRLPEEPPAGHQRRGEPGPFAHRRPGPHPRLLPPYLPRNGRSRRADRPPRFRFRPTGRPLPNATEHAADLPGRHRLANVAVDRLATGRRLSHLDHRRARRRYSPARAEGHRRLEGLLTGSVHRGRVAVACGAGRPPRAGLDASPSSGSCSRFPAWEDRCKPWRSRGWRGRCT